MFKDKALIESYFFQMCPGIMQKHLLDLSMSQIVTVLAREI